jgi:hypothetical protein
MYIRILFLFLIRKNKREKWKSMFILTIVTRTEYYCLQFNIPSEGSTEKLDFFVKELFLNNVLQNKIGHSAKFRLKLILSSF